MNNVERMVLNATLNQLEVWRLPEANVKAIFGTCPIFSEVPTRRPIALSLQLDTDIDAASLKLAQPLSPRECPGPGLLERIERMFRSPLSTTGLVDGGPSKKPRKGGSTSFQTGKQLVLRSCW